jgi:hypothetical protein
MAVVLKEQQQKFTSLSPSDFAFLRSECACCYYNKLHGVIDRPDRPMPKIFNAIDKAMKNDLVSGNVSIPGVDRPFKVVLSDKKVRSAPFQFADEPPLLISGTLDTLVEFEDGTLALVDEKTGEIKPHLIEKYGAQLHAYKYALEYPADPVKMPPRKIDRIALIVFQPAVFGSDGAGNASLQGAMRWIEVPVDESRFVQSRPRRTGRANSANIARTSLRPAFKRSRLYVLSVSP